MVMSAGEHFHPIYCMTVCGSLLPSPFLSRTPRSQPATLFHFQLLPFGGLFSKEVFLAPFSFFEYLLFNVFFLDIATCTPAFVILLVSPFFPIYIFFPSFSSFFGLSSRTTYTSSRKVIISTLPTFTNGLTSLFPFACSFGVQVI